MKTLFLIISLSLFAALQAQDPLALGEETPDVSGKWYLKAVTTDQEIPGKRPELVTPMTLTALEGGNLEVKTSILVSGQCREMKLVLEKTDKPGKYTAYGRKFVAYILPSHVKDHYILYWEGELQGKQIRGAKLVGRDPENNQGALEDFKTFTRDRGFNLEIFTLKQSGQKTLAGSLERPPLHTRGNRTEACLAPAILCPLRVPLEPAREGTSKFATLEMNPKRAQKRPKETGSDFSYVTLFLCTCRAFTATQ
ncbi:lipocalin-1-like [Diceros bicornis minor]|uniref:lipocalin-1-like n=1 Tax=Diceros bicornis minor TaxID=77932 RepID=UPI0026F00804|nr:lipocalin-1-like [Diceros bicornis minor]